MPIEQGETGRERRQSFSRRIWMRSRVVCQQKGFLRMLVDITAVRSGQISFAEAVRSLKHADLRRALDELFADLESDLVNVDDAATSFTPRDPEATDKSEQGWSVSHVVAHFTATLESTLAGAAMLARGVELKEQLRYETPWESLSTRSKVQARLRESLRMSRAFLDAWPDEPHFDLTVTPIPQLGPMNAIGLSTLGLMHGQMHLDQIREALRQANTR